MTFAEAAEFALEELEEKAGKKYWAIIRLWRIGLFAVEGVGLVGASVAGWRSRSSEVGGVHAADLKTSPVHENLRSSGCAARCRATATPRGGFTLAKSSLPVPKDGPVRSRVVLAWISLVRGSR